MITQSSLHIGAETIHSVVFFFFPLLRLFIIFTILSSACDHVGGFWVFLLWPYLDIFPHVLKYPTLNTCLSQKIMSHFMCIILFYHYLLFYHYPMGSDVNTDVKCINRKMFITQRYFLRRIRQPSSGALVWLFNVCRSKANIGIQEACRNQTFTKAHLATQSQSPPGLQK